MRRILLGDYPRRTLPLGIISPGERVERSFELRPYVDPVRKAEIARSVDAKKIEDIDLSRFLNDCCAAVLSKLGDVYNPTREHVCKVLTRWDRFFILIEAMLEHQGEQYSPVGICNNPFCASGVLTPPAISLKSLPVFEPEPGDFLIHEGRWGFDAEWPEHGVRSARLLLTMAGEEEEREAKNQANPKYPAGDFWLLSQTVVDLNGEGPLKEEQLRAGRRRGAFDPRKPDADATERFDEELPRCLLKLLNAPAGDVSIGVDPRLDIECGCGFENHNNGRVDVAARFLGISDLKGSPRTKIKLPTSPAVPGATS